MLKRESTKYLFWLAISFLVAGAVGGYLPRNSNVFEPLYLSHIAIISLLTFAWSRSHAIESGVASNRRYSAFAALFPPLGVPVYFFRFFGLKQGVLKVLKAAVFFVILGIVYLLPYVILQTRHA
ncbi:MAG TPA: hypothetical protein VGA88_03125 [Burkholderiales bacterium]